MTRAELKEWAKKKVEGKRLFLAAVIIVASALIGLSLPIGPAIKYGEYSSRMSIPVGIFLSFVSVGLVYFIINFITDKNYQFNDIFAYSKDFMRIFVVTLLQSLFIFLFSLLLVIPGVIKSFAYSLVNMILSDSKYNDLGYMDVLKKSEEMMKGHKMDLFVLGLSFIGWHILAIFTLGILEFWILPYQTVATTKFLYDIKTEYEKNNGTLGTEEKEEKKTKKEPKEEKEEE